MQIDPWYRLALTVGAPNEPRTRCGSQPPSARRRHGSMSIVDHVNKPPPFPRLHLAFVASSRQQVDKFFEVALREGAHSNGEPGLRDLYHPGYYAALVLDPDGHNIEAVFRGDCAA